MTRKEKTLESLNRRIPQLEEKIQADQKLLEKLKAQRDTLEFETLKKMIHENGMTTEEMIHKLSQQSKAFHDYSVNLEDKDAKHEKEHS